MLSQNSLILQEKESECIYIKQFVYTIERRVKMTADIIDLLSRKKIRSVKISLAELTELEKTLKTVINSLTKYQKFSNIKKRTEELFNEYKDVQRAIESKKEILKTLIIRDV